MMIFVIVNIIILEISINIVSSQSSLSCNISSHLEIKSLMNGKCLDVAGGNTASGTNVQMYDCIGVNGQKWYYDYSTKEIKNINPNGDDLCLDLENGNTAEGTNIRMLKCNQHNAQKWLLNSDGTISNINGGCLDIKNGINDNGANVNLWSCSSDNINEQWMLISEIKSVMNGKCLDVINGETNPDANVQMHACNGHNAQKWYYNKLTKEIKNHNADPNKDDLCLDLLDNDATDGTNIRMWPCNGENAQKWFLNADGTITNINGGCMEIYLSNHDNNANVNKWTCYATQTNQKWFGIFMPKKPTAYPRAYSLPGCDGYRSLVTYIGNDYDTAKSAGHEWCLSIGLIDGNRDKHEIATHEHNLYWCDNSASANQNCKCLGFKFIAPGILFSSTWNIYYYKIHGITYRLQFGGRGNQIGTCEENVKADMNGEKDTWGWSQWNSLCRGSGGCCMEWDLDIQSFMDTIDGTSKAGREAKCALGIRESRCKAPMGIPKSLGCSEHCPSYNRIYGDRMEWK